MAKSKIVLPNGTLITVEGNPEEIKTVLSFYSHPAKQDEHRTQTKKITKSQKPSIETDEAQTDAVMDIVTSIKESDEAENVETNILDRPSQIDRILLPLYINQKYHDNKYRLTTGEIAKVLAELGVPINISNVSTAVKSSAQKYVVGDKARKKGQAVRYKLSLRGFKYMTAVIRGSGHGKQN